MKTIIVLLSLSFFLTGYAQQQYQYTTSADINKVNNIVPPREAAPKEVVDLALYQGKNADYKNVPTKNPNATYHYKGKDYYMQPSKNGYLMHTSKKDPSHSVICLKKVGHGNGFLFIDDADSSSYAYFDSKSNLIIEFYDRKAKKIKQLKIGPKIIKSH